MSYSLNSILFSVYGLVPSQAPSSNIALAGCFDMPIRRGDLFYEWGDENGVEAYVDAADFMFDGREITCHCVMLGTRSEVEALLKSFYSAVKIFTSTVALITDYGTFNVYVQSVRPTITNGAANIEIVFREPIVDLTGTLPDVGISNTNIDGIPLSSFGLYFSSVLGQRDLQEMKEQYFTSYETEGFQITKRKANTLTINGFVLGSSLEDFKSKVSSLYALYSSANVKNITLSGNNYGSHFPVNGFSITDIIVHSNGVIGRFTTDLISATYADYILLTEAGVEVLTDNDTQIIISIYG